MTGAEGTDLERHFGQWSTRYRRYTSNLTSPRIHVRVLADGEEPTAGIQCIVHWVPRAAMLSTGAGSICQGDGWPVALWRQLTSRIHGRGEATIAARLRALAMDTADTSDDPVTAWRVAITRGEVDTTSAERAFEGRWIPVPADLSVGEERSACIVSWSPTAPFFPSLSEAIRSGTRSNGQQVDLLSQAAYYLECTLATLHGVRFGADDHILDRQYEGTPELAQMRPLFQARELQYVQNSAFGNLSQHGRL
jgi:hypothetical protein